MSHKEKFIKVKAKARSNIRSKKRKKRRRQIPGPGKLKKGLWEFTLAYFDYSCAYCGDSVEITKDHVRPRSLGGSSKVYNIIPACRDCNKDKDSEALSSWYPRQSFYSTKRYAKIIKFLLKTVRGCK